MSEPVITRELLMDLLGGGFRLGFVRDLRLGPVFLLFDPYEQCVYAETLAELLEARRQA